MRAGSRGKGAAETQAETDTGPGKADLGRQIQYGRLPRGAREILRFRHGDGGIF